MKAWRFIFFASVLIIVCAFAPDYFDSIPDKEKVVNTLSTILLILIGIDIYELFLK